METRKLVRVGKNSLIVSLPRGWLSSCNLSKGSEVYLDVQKDKLVITNGTSVDVGKPLKKAVLIVDNDSFEAIKRKICAEYINNSNLIEIKGGSVAKYVQEIKNFLREFMVFEIIEEKDDLVVAKDYLNLDTITKEGIAERFYSILKSVFEDVNKEIDQDVFESLQYREKQINKYYFLMQRYIRHHIEDQSSQEDRSSLLDYWQTAIYLESLGDSLLRISRQIYLNQISLNSDKNLRNLLKICKDYFVKNMDAFSERNSDKFARIAETRFELLNKIDKYRGNIVNKEDIILLIKNTHKACRVLLNDRKIL